MFSSIGISLMISSDIVGKLTKNTNIRDTKGVKSAII